MGLYQTKVEQGFLEGTDQGDYAVYKGVPYAKPPVGDLRFCPPQKSESWTGVRKAVEFPPIAWQKPLPEGSFYEKEFYRGDDSLRNRSEDCLYLNIWTPAEKKEDRLPVLFWIHGGAFRQQTYFSPALGALVQNAGYIVPVLCSHMPPPCPPRLQYTPLVRPARGQFLPRRVFLRFPH